MLRFLAMLALFVAPAALAADAPETPEQVVESMKKELGAGFHYRATRCFAVASDAPESELDSYCRNTVAACYDAYMKQFFKVKPAAPFRVYLFKDKASYESNAKRLFGEMPDTPFGYYTPDHRALVMNIATGGGTLVHEMFHALVAGDFPGIPSWANEGFASLFEQCGVGPEGLTGYVNWRLPILQKAIKDKSLPTLRQLMNSTDAEFYKDRQGKYAAARYFMLWLQEKGLLEKFYRAFRDRFAEDKTGVKFAEEIIGQKLEAFEPGWREWVMTLRY